jgi:hypothetical protein
LRRAAAADALEGIASACIGATTGTTDPARAADPASITDPAGTTDPACTADPACTTDATCTTDAPRPTDSSTAVSTVETAEIAAPIRTGNVVAKLLAGCVVAIGDALAMAGVVLPPATLRLAAIEVAVDMVARLTLMLTSPPPQLQLPKIAPAAAKPNPKAIPAPKA